jgi:methyl-accepting chemotaxis protein
MKISQKLLLALMIVIIGFLLFGWYSFFTLTQVKINGQIYNELKQGHDLIADILPPPEYIIESYLTLFEMRDNMENSDKINELSDYFTNKLKQEYYERHEYWAKDDLFLSKNKTNHDALIKNSYSPADEFYKIAEQEYLPAINSKDTSKVNDLLNGKLKQLYSDHRKYIDDVVKMASDRNVKTESDATDIIKSSTIKLITLFVITMIISICMFLIVISQIVSTLKSTCNTMRDITMENDLTDRVNITSKDEIGELFNYFNQFVNKLQGIIRHITESSDTVASSATEFSASSSQIAANAEKMSSQTAMVASSTEQATMNIHTIASAAEEMSSSANSVATAIEEMSASLNEVAMNCQKELHIAEDAGNHARSGKEIMDRLSNAAKSIGNVVETIDEIADQTNLLALNATIEAARAGEAGKGFAVVANEVKELAMQTAHATQEIKKHIENIQNNSESAAQAMDLITHAIDEVNSISHSIVSAVEEQSVTVNEIAKNVSGVSDGSQDIARNVAESAKGLGQVAKTINGVNNSATEISQGISQVKVSADDLSKLSEGLRNLVKQFKV